MSAPADNTENNKHDRLISVLKKTAAVFAALFLIIGVMFLATVCTTYNKAFFRMENRLNGTGEKLELSDEYLDLLAERIILYFSGQEDDLQTYVMYDNTDELVPFYTEDELSHMVDVLDIFVYVNHFAIIFPVAAALIILVLAFFTKDPKKTLGFGALTGSSVVLAIFLTVGLWIAVDFNGAFNFFHQIFFPQGNWTFSTDMIVLLPENLFLHAALIICSVCLIASAVLFGFGLSVTKKQRANRKLFN